MKYTVWDSYYFDEDDISDHVQIDADSPLGAAREFFDPDEEDESDLVVKDQSGQLHEFRCVREVEVRISGRQGEVR